MAVARNRQIDLLKGIAVFLVLWGHCLQYMSLGSFDYYENFMYRIIYSFHMPLFMAISGYLFYFSCRKYPFPGLIEKVAKSTLYPALLWNILSQAAQIALADGEARQQLIKKVVTGFGVAFTDLWFLWSVSFCSIAVALAYRLIPHRRWRGASYIIAFLVVALIPAAVFPAKTMTLWMYPFFVAGVLFPHDLSRVPRRTLDKAGIACLVAYAVLMPFFHRDNYIYTTGLAKIAGEKGWGTQIYLDAFRWFLGLCGVGAVCFLVCRFVSPFLSGTREKLAQGIFRLAGVSLQIYILQSILLERVFKSVFARFCQQFPPMQSLVSHTVVYSLILTPLVALIFSFGLYFLSVLFRKMRVSTLLFGR